MASTNSSTSTTTTKPRLDWGNEELLKTFVEKVKERRVLCGHRELTKNFDNLPKELGLSVKGTALQSKFKQLASDVRSKIISIYGQEYDKVNYREIPELKEWERTLLDALSDGDRSRKENPTATEQSHEEGEHLMGIGSSILNTTGAETIEQGAKHPPPQVIYIINLLPFHCVCNV
jgi:hypothetical protein